MNKDKEKILEAIRGLAFFQGMKDEHLTRVVDISRFIEFPPRSTIFDENDPANDVYVVISGGVSLSICTPKVGCRQLADISAGEMIGWSPLVGRGRMSDTARTITESSLIAISGEKLLALCGEVPQFGFEFMHRAAQVLAERLGAVRLQLLHMTGHRLPAVPIESD